ncbi:MAG: hypothetical protein OXB98_02620 [Bryobacterales bacterium]|nr:hypothetical protein [Bryobacterales bacterium]
MNDLTNWDSRIWIFSEISATALNGIWAIAFFVEDDNDVRLGEVRAFTFEPHIRKLHGRWGFKHENIYFFSRNGSLEFEGRIPAVTRSRGPIRRSILGSVIVPQCSRIPLLLSHQP